jgi:parvulin-like peptidyl-prolyl isomerase
MTNRIRRARRAIVMPGVVCAIVFVTGAAAIGQMLDRVLAVVGGEPITLSDVNAAITLGLAAQTEGDPVQQTLEALIDRQLQLVEVNRYVPPEPHAADIDARVADVRSRFASEAAFESTLEQAGVTADQLRARVRDTLRIESYLQQRFGAAYQPSEEEITRYYRAHESDFMRAGVLRPYSESRGEARTRLIDERSASLVRDWVSGLRRRVEVTVLPK